MDISENITRYVQEQQLKAKLMRDANFDFDKNKFEASVALSQEQCIIYRDNYCTYISNVKKIFVFSSNVNVDKIRTYLNEAIQFYKYCIKHKLLPVPVNKGIYIIHEYLEEQKMNYVNNVLMALPNCDFYQSQMYDSNIFIYIVPKFLFVFFGKN